MAATLRRFYSSSVRNSLKGIFLGNPFIQKQFRLPWSSRSLSFSSDYQFGSATTEVTSNVGESGCVFRAYFEFCWHLVSINLSRTPSV